MCDLFLDLIDQFLERAAAEAPARPFCRPATSAASGIPLRGFEASFSCFQAGGDSECSYHQLHETFRNRIAVGGEDSSTRSSNSDSSTTCRSRNGKPSRSSCAISESSSKSVPIKSTQSTSLGSIASVTKLPFRTRPLTPRPLHEVDQPPERLDLDAAELRVAPWESGFDLIECGRVNSRWQVSVVFKWRDHLISLRAGFGGFPRPYILAYSSASWPFLYLVLQGIAPFGERINGRSSAWLVRGIIIEAPLRQRALGRRY